MAADQQRPTDGASRQAELTRRLRLGNTGPVVAGIPRGRDGGPAPLSFAQQRVWWFAELAPGCAVYARPLALRLLGPLDADALDHSLTEIVARHAILRTTFRVHDGQPVQLVTPEPEAPLALPLVDLGRLPASDRLAEALRRANAEARRPFDLRTGPLLRGTLFRLGEAEHLLALVVHHIAFDGWSATVFRRELAALYGARLNARRSPLPVLPIQYADYAIWARAHGQTATLDNDLAYWRRQMTGAPPRLELPTDHPRRSAPSYSGDLHAFTLEAPLVHRLTALGREEGATLYMVLLAAFQALLARYTGQDDIVIGSPVAGRGRPELEALIGCFINTLPLRTSLAGDPTFRALLARVREVCRAAYAHQELPFERLVQELQPARDPSRSPIVQVLFNFRNVPAEVPPLAALESTECPVDTGTTLMDLTLDVTPREGGLACVLQYATDLFAAATIERLAGHWQVLLQGIAADPDQHLAELPLLTQPERHQLLVAWNQTAAPTPPETVPTLVAHQAAQTPQAAGVVAGSQRLSYAALNARANQLAHHLRALGVGPDVPVGVCLDRSVDLVVGLLGILKAGGAYLPLDPSYPPARLAFMLQDSQAAVLVTQADLVDRLAGHPAPVVCLDGDRAALARQPTSNPPEDPSPDHLAYIIYTSGSTGLPKGVAVEHRGVANLVSWARSTFGPDLARVLASTSVCFDLSVFELFAPLTTGGTVVLVDNVLDLASAAPARTATLVNTVPSALTELLRLGPLPATVRTVNLAGETLPAELARRLYEQPTVDRVVNLYGPTETTVYSTGAVVPRSSDGPPAIGRPLANTRVYVLDDYMQPVPATVPGELYIGGAGLARGYVGQPAMTDERFVRDPFAAAPGARLYRTGDRARWRSDGELEFLGRRDAQVKVRGYRVELAEVEAALARHAGVRRVAVAAREVAPNDVRLVAYVVPAGAATAADELRAFLRGRLPDYMVPSAYVALATLPTTPNGKLDRAALPAPEGTRPELRKALVAPRDRLERQLQALWERLLNVRPIGVTDDFFELGGHSLLVARLFAEVEALVGRKLSPAALFQAPTIARLADWLRVGGGSPGRGPLVPIQPRGDRPLLFCVHQFSGSVLGYANLARHLGPDQPVYGLQSRGVDGEAQPDEDIESMAARYIEAMRAAQAVGPFRLAGHCFGGSVAFEMARQLHAQGERVALLAIIEGFAPRRTLTAPGRWRLRGLASSLRNLWYWGSDVVRQSPAEIAERLRHRGRLGIRQLGALRGHPESRLQTELRDEVGDLSQFTEQTLAIMERHLQAALRYGPGVYPGRVSLFRVRKQPVLRAHDPAKGWSTLTSQGVDIHMVPGSHLSLLEEPHVQGLAAQLRDCLDRMPG